MISKADQRLAEFIAIEGGEVAHDMSHHVADQIFELLKRNGMNMRSEAASLAMLALAARNVLGQAIDIASRATETDCTGPILQLFLSDLPAQLDARLQLTLTPQPVETAPKDGTRILAFVVHPNADLTENAGGDRSDWEGWVVAHWIEHNGGGWTWHGHLGTFTHWAPLPGDPKP